MARAALFVLVASLLLFGCSKGDPPSASASASESASASASALASASAPASASASATAPTLAPTPALAPTPTPAPTLASAPALASASAPTPARAPTTAKAAPTCGDKPLPLCPLHAWMKANTAPAMSAEDYGALVTAFEKIAGFAPPGYAHWRSIARDGADAARVEQLDAVKAACRGCHNQYKDRYKKEMRDRPI